MEGDPIGFVWNDGLGTAINDFSAKVVAVVSFVADEGRHGWRELQKDRRCGNICILAWSEMMRKVCNQGHSARGFLWSAHRASGRSPVHAPAFSTARRAIRFDRGRVDGQSQAVLAAAGERLKDRLPMSALGPAIEAM